MYLTLACQRHNGLPLRVTVVERSGQDERDFSAEHRQERAKRIAELRSRAARGLDLFPAEVGNA